MATASHRSMPHSHRARALIASLTNTTCPLANAEATDETSFWEHGGIDWDAHRIGWAIAGGCTVVVCLVSGTNVSGGCHNSSLNGLLTPTPSPQIWLHCRNYRKP